MPHPIRRMRRLFEDYKKNITSMMQLGNRCTYHKPDNYNSISKNVRH